MKIKVEEDDHCIDAIETTASSHEASAQKRKLCELELSNFLVSKNESLRKCQRQNTSMTPRLRLSQTRVDQIIPNFFVQLDSCSQKPVNTKLLSIYKPLSSLQYRTEVLPVSTKACVVNQEKLSRSVIVTPDITVIHSQRLVNRTFTIQAERCGQFIGINGSNIKLIAEYTTARISIDKVSNNGIRKIQVEGLQNSITFFAKIIDAFKKSMSFLDNRKVTWVHEIVASLNENQKITDMKKPHKLREKCLNTSDALIMSESHIICRSISIPVERSGEFIGIKAAFLNELQTFTNTVITMTKFIINKYRSIHVKGSEACVKKTLKMIEYFCSSIPYCGKGNKSWVPDVIEKITKSQYESTDNLNLTIDINHVSSNESYPVSKTGSLESMNISYVSTGTRTSRNTNPYPSIETESEVMRETPNKSIASTNCNEKCPTPIVEPKVCKAITHSKEDKSPLLDFLKTRVDCLKCSPEEFCSWLRSEDICSLSDLLDAFAEDEFVRNDMQNNGLKGFRRQTLQKACIARLIDTNG